jgi:hypothetical protein
MRIKYKATGHERDVPDAIGQALVDRKIAYVAGTEPAPKKRRAPSKPAAKKASKRTRAVKADEGGGEGNTQKTYTTRDMRAEG